MTSLKLTDKEQSTARHALEVAAQRFDEDAQVIFCEIAFAHKPLGLAYTRVLDQFVRQAEDTRALMEKFEP